MKGGIYYCKDSIGHEDIKDIKIAHDIRFFFRLLFNYLRQLASEKEREVNLKRKKWYFEY